MLTRRDIRNAIDAARKDALALDRNLTALAADRNRVTSPAIKAACSAEILAATRALHAANEKANALDAALRYFPPTGEPVVCEPVKATIAPTPEPIKVPDAPKAKAVTIAKGKLPKNPKVGDVRMTDKGRVRFTETHKWMFADARTASEGQQNWLRDHGVKGAHLFSMAGASDRRFEMTRKNA